MGDVWLLHLIDRSRTNRTFCLHTIKFCRRGILEVVLSEFSNEILEF